MMNETELKLLEQLAFGEITEEQFLKDYPVNLEQDKKHLISLINTATKEKDGENLDLLLEVIASLEIYEDFDFQSKYRDLIKENWHRMHEELVDSLDKTEINEDCFIHVLNQTYDYHADGVEDFMVPIWSKCLWALYKIGTKKGLKEIQKFSTSKYDYLKSTVDNLLSKVND